MTKRFSLVVKCNVFLQCCITLGPQSLVFVAECLKIIADSHLQIQNYKTEVQLKPKLSVFPKIV